MSQQQPGITSNRIFAAFYERTSQSGMEKGFMTPLREEVGREARGVVLEVGAGTGLNFSYYDAEQVERVEAIEPDTAMLDYARKRAENAAVRINLTLTPAERLPFADETFDSAVTTLVFCSVTDPLRGLQEVRRVLKPGGAFMLVEHVRAQGPVLASMQSMMTPFTKRLAGNCHWNRNTEQTVYAAGFQMVERRDLGGFLMPVIVLKVRKV